jgi:hypothetical protein
LDTPAALATSVIVTDRRFGLSFVWLMDASSLLTGFDQAAIVYPDWNVPNS